VLSHRVEQVSGNAAGDVALSGRERASDLLQDRVRIAQDIADRHRGRALAGEALYHLRH
jgi:hypothetical protein